MKKTQNQYKSYKPVSGTFSSISAHEAALLAAMSDFTFFSQKQVRRMTRWKAQRVVNTLQALKKKNILTSIKKDLYLLTERIPEHLFAVATYATAPAYISLWTAASYYGITEQQVKAIQVISTKQYPYIDIRGHRVEIYTVTPERFYGYQKIEDFAIAEKEKLIIDMLFHLEASGGIEEYKKCLSNVWNDINQKVLLSYLLQFQNKSITARMGYLLETLQLKNTIEKEMKKHLPQGYVLLNPQKKPTKKYVKSWKVIVNDE